MKELFLLFYYFAKIGLFTFGGGLAMLPMIKKEVVEKNKEDTDKTVIDDKKLHDILEEVGVPNEKLVALDTVYETSCGNAPLTASNLIETKTVLTSPGYSTPQINFKRFSLL